MTSTSEKHESSGVSSASTRELPFDELDKVSGGVTLTYGSIAWTYTAQRPG
ncbi:hypothetical protein Q2941_37250 [Bradyrhizobium sp. UFLA05-153]